MSCYSHSGYRDLQCLQNNYGHQVLHVHFQLCAYDYGQLHFSDRFLSALPIYWLNFRHCTVVASDSGCSTSTLVLSRLLADMYFLC